MFQPERYEMLNLNDGDTRLLTGDRVALRDAIIAHPTMAEGLGELFSNVPPRSKQ